MMAKSTTESTNGNLLDAKRAKFDEFYTRYVDIENELMAYYNHNQDVFRGKTVLLPCDDPEWSNFTKFFTVNFELFGVKKLISTGYSNSGNGKISVNGSEWQYLQGNGDFRSEEVTKLRDEADIIVTNPPFSLFREFLAWIVEADKQFLLIGNMNAITYKEVFPLIKNNKMWTGIRFNQRLNGKNMTFFVPDNYKLNGTEVEISSDGKKMISVAGTGWFTNLDHGRRHQPLQLMTMADNLKYSKHKEIKANGYQKYDNYDAIEIPFTDAIPSDYQGVMGVPISFLDKYCPEQFEIVGCSYDYGRPNNWPETINMNVSVNGINVYKRILIKHRKDESNE